MNTDGVIGQTLVAVTLGHFAGKHSAEGAVGVDDGHVDLDGLAPLQGSCRQFHKLTVEDVVDIVGLVLAIVYRYIRPCLGLVKNTRVIQPLGFPVAYGVVYVEKVAAADYLMEGAETYLRHQFPYFLSDKEEIIDYVLGLAGEALAQFRILGGHPHRTGIEMAFAHHDTAGRDQGRGGKTKLVGPQHGADYHVASGAQAAVHLDRDTAAQPVEHQGLMSFGESDFPWRARMLDGGQGRSAGAAIKAGDGDVIGAGLGHARRHRAYAHLGS